MVCRPSPHRRIKSANDRAAFRMKLKLLHGRIMNAWPPGYTPPRFALSISCPTHTTADLLPDRESATHTEPATMIIRSWTAARHASWGLWYGSHNLRGLCRRHIPTYEYHKYKYIHAHSQNTCTHIDIEIRVLTSHVYMSIYLHMHCKTHTHTHYTHAHAHTVSRFA